MNIYEVSFKNRDYSGDSIDDKNIKANNFDNACIKAKKMLVGMNKDTDGKIVIIKVEEILTIDG